MFSDDINQRNFDFFILKIFLLLGLNLFVSYNFEAYNNPINVALFNASVLILWFLWYMGKTVKLYQNNLRKLPTTAKSAETPESREKDRGYREMALRDACRGKETDMRELNW